MEGLGLILSWIVIWWWFNPDSAGRWVAKAKKAFIQEAKL